MKLKSLLAAIASFCIAITSLPTLATAEGGGAHNLHSWGSPHHPTYKHNVHHRGYSYRHHKGYHYRHHKGHRYRHHNGYHYKHHRRGNGAAIAAGIIGLTAAGIIAHQASRHHKYNHGYRIRANSPNWIAACARKYKTFNPNTGLYKANSGRYRRCRL